jgi:diguanylate cyclase (GGDEF)-like protein
MLDWALAAAAAAGQRIADLEERLAHLESLSVTDELTGVLNRRGFLRELSRAVAAATRGGPRGVLILGDLDGFKAINDRHGHRAGNELLRQVATALQSRVRQNDVVGRLGGDEFALLLIGATLPNARRKCVCFNRALTGAMVDALAVPLSVSFGVVAYDGSEDPEALLHRADMAMYAEKREHGERQQLEE